MNLKSTFDSFHKKLSDLLKFYKVEQNLLLQLMSDTQREQEVEVSLSDPFSGKLVSDPIVSFDCKHSDGLYCVHSIESVANEFWRTKNKLAEAFDLRDEYDEGETVEDGIECKRCKQTLGLGNFYYDSSLEEPIMKISKLIDFFNRDKISFVEFAKIRVNLADRKWRLKIMSIVEGSFSSKGENLSYPEIQDMYEYVKKSADHLEPRYRNFLKDTLKEALLKNNQLKRSDLEWDMGWEDDAPKDSEEPFSSRMARGTNQVNSDLQFLHNKTDEFESEEPESEDESACSAKMLDLGNTDDGSSAVIMPIFNSIKNQFGILPQVDEEGRLASLPYLYKLNVLLNGVELPFVLLPQYSVSLLKSNILIIVTDGGTVFWEKINDMKEKDNKEEAENIVDGPEIVVTLKNTFNLNKRLSSQRAVLNSTRERLLLFCESLENKSSSSESLLFEIYLDRKGELNVEPIQISFEFDIKYCLASHFGSNEVLFMSTDDKSYCQRYYLYSLDSQKWKSKALEKGEIIRGLTWSIDINAILVINHKYEVFRLEEKTSTLNKVMVEEPPQFTEAPKGHGKYGVLFATNKSTILFADYNSRNWDLNLKIEDWGKEHAIHSFYHDFNQGENERVLEEGEDLKY